MIQARALAYRYPGAAASLGFGDLDVLPGGQVLVLGRSGVGKSTWLALLAGLLTPTDGRLVVAGLELSQASARERDAWRGRCIGFLPQSLHLSDALTVQGNLELAYVACGLDVDRPAIGHVLERLGIQALASRRPQWLSGGERLRVALARAVLRRPRVILADEPTASLDDESAQAALHLLVQASADAEATLVIATHDQRVRAALTQAQVASLSQSDL